MLKFFANRGDSLNMMTEVLREIASRNLFTAGQHIVRVRVVIEGWCAAKTYDLCAEILKRLIMVEEESGARMLLKEVKEFEGSKDENMPLTWIGVHVKMQQDEVGYFEVRQFSGHLDNLHILRKSQKWFIHEFFMSNLRPVNQLTVDQVDQMKRHWRYLAKSTAGGQIKMLMLRQNAGQSFYDEILESVRKVWEISDNVKVKLEDQSQVVRRGGRIGENREESWQEFRAVLQL